MSFSDSQYMFFQEGRPHQGQVEQKVSLLVENSYTGTVDQAIVKE